MALPRFCKRHGKFVVEPRDGRQATGTTAANERGGAMTKTNDLGGITRSWRAMFSTPGSTRRTPRPKAPTIPAGTLAQFDGSQLLLLARITRARKGDEMFSLPIMKLN